MKIIIPMAGLGKRMRPHTLTTPKPLIPIAGKSIVQRLVESIAASCPEKIDEIAYVTGNFGAETEEKLKSIAADAGAGSSVFYQTEALGIAHAVLCAREALKGKVMVAFADTLFKADFSFDNTADGMIWVQKVEDPSQFGVVKVNEKNIITDFVEKPQQYVSNLAIIGIYYFSDGEFLRKELQYLLDHKIKEKGEYQFTSALENMKNKGVKFTIGKVYEWLDCGNKNSTIQTNRRILEHDDEENRLSHSLQLKNSVIIPPCFIGEKVKLVNSVVGPYVSIGDYSSIEDSVIKNSIVQNYTKISCLNIHNSMLGNYVDLKHKKTELNVGDYTTQHYEE